MLNKVMVIGNLGQDPEIRQTQSGQQVATLRVATTERYKDKDGHSQEKTEWHTCVLWGKLAELAGKYLSKGSRVYLEGKLQTRQWDDQNGQKRYSTEIVVQEMKFLTPKGEAGGAPAGSNARPSLDMPDEEVPF